MLVAYCYAVVWVAQPQAGSDRKMPSASLPLMVIQRGHIPTMGTCDLVNDGMRCPESCSDRANPPGGVDEESRRTTVRVILILLP